MDRYQIASIHASPSGRRLAQRQPLTQSVYQVVVDMLMTQTLEPLARLSIEELARTLGVSPTPVREALARVEADGMIIKEPGRGYTVAPLMGIDQVRDLIELRMLVEPSAAAKAAKRATSAEITTLRSLARAGGATHDSGGAASRIDMTYDATFHAMVADVAGNKIVSEMLARLRGHLHTYRLRYQAADYPLTKREHVAVIRAVAQRDPDAAEEAMRAHLTAALERMERFASQAASAQAR